MSSPTVQGAHLVGSINLPDAETTFRTAAAVLGDRLKRIPDGEVGDRFHWIAFQPDVLGATPGLERIGDQPVFLDRLDQRPLRIADGVDPASLQLPPLGYAHAALESWDIFQRLQNDGVIPGQTRFQVSLPTPAAVITAYVEPDSQARFEPVYEAAMFRELDQILKAIPYEKLAIQWDSAVEFGIIEKAGYGTLMSPWWDGDVWDGIIQRAARQAAQVPKPVDLGYHLCYGDVAERHFVEPADTGNLVTFIERVQATARRPIDWFHLPVPIGRDDERYFAPLGTLSLTDNTEIYLGLVHREDGVDGARRRELAASAHLRHFGIATECGCGRAPEKATLPLLEIHREVTAPW